MMSRIVSGLLRRTIGWIIAHGSERSLKDILRLQSVWISNITRRSIELSKSDPEAAKPMLVTMLDFEKSVDRAINQLANHFYLGKHPKHYLWTSHNDFIVDSVEQGESVIDVGCGASQYTVRLAEKGAKVLGVDINAQRIETIQKNNMHPNLKYAVMDVAEELPREKFDVAICSHILEHMDNPVAFLSSLHNIASKIIVKVPRVDSGWKKLMKKDLGIFWLDDADHRKEYTWGILLDELERSGWKPVKQETGLDLRVIARCKNEVNIRCSPTMCNKLMRHA